MDYRDYAIEMVENEMIDRDYLIGALLKYMSQDEVRDCLESNELTERFFIQGEVV